MAMEPALVARLQMAAGLNLYAGSRVAWGMFPRATGGNRVLISPISPGREYDHDGPDGLDGPTVQIDCLATDFETALAMADAVRDEMESETEVDGTRFYPAQQIGGGFSDEGEQEGGLPLVRVSRDYQFYHEEV